MKRTVSDLARPWQNEFVRMLPAIETHARISFRFLPADLREERIANAVALAYLGYHSLARRNRLGQAYAGALANFAVRATRSGRIAGSGQTSRDVLSTLAQQRHGFRTVHMGRQCLPVWRQVARVDSHVDPAEQAVFNLDFASWLRTLSRRLRRIVGMLAAGWRTGEVARRFRLSAGRISHFRRILEESWLRFQGLAVAFNA
jgi:hypothetical protein